MTVRVLDTCLPLTPERWIDLEVMFGEHGAVGGCWCMDRRLARGEFLAGRGAPNRERLRTLAARERAPGLIGYRDGEPVAWVAVGPRSDFPVIDRSIVTRALQDRADWVIACLFVARGHRRTGVGTDLIRAAVDFAHENGAEHVEGYPIDRGERPTVDAFAFTGTARQFTAVGFTEVTRPRPTRPVMRRAVR